MATPDLHVFDLLMLPHPEDVNREEMTYVVLGPKNQQTRVTKENWDIGIEPKSIFPLPILVPFQPF